MRLTDFALIANVKNLKRIRIIYRYRCNSIIVKYFNQFIIISIFLTTELINVLRVLFKN